MPLKRKTKIVIGLEKYDRIDEIAERFKDMHDVEFVNDSEEAYHAIHVFKPDIAILDYALSKIHPIELYEGIALAHSSVHFVICVTEENYRVAQTIWKQRSCDFIFKPFFPEQFMSDVNKIVRNVYDMREINELKLKIDDLKNEINRLNQQLKAVLHEKQREIQILRE